MKGALKIYNDYLSIGDKRVENWLLMDTPVLTSVILVTYFISIYAIKLVMANRKPFDLKGFLYLYNFAQVVVSFYISCEVIYRSLNVI